MKLQISARARVAGAALLFVGVLWPRTASAHEPTTEAGLRSARNFLVLEVGFVGLMGADGVTFDRGADRTSGSTFGPSPSADLGLTFGTRLERDLLYAGASGTRVATFGTGLNAGLLTASAGVELPLFGRAIVPFFGPALQLWAVQHEEGDRSDPQWGTDAHVSLAIEGGIELLPFVVSVGRGGHKVPTLTGIVLDATAPVLGGGPWMANVTFCLAAAQ